MEFLLSLFLVTVTSVFQLKIHWTEVQSCFVHVSYDVYFLWYSVRLELCIKLTVKVKVKFNLEEATKVQRGGRV